MQAVELKLIHFQLTESVHDFPGTKKQAAVAADTLVLLLCAHLPERFPVESDIAQIQTQIIEDRLTGAADYPAADKANPVNRQL